MEIPAKYSIRAYFREQFKLVEPLVEFLSGEMPLRWLTQRSAKLVKREEVSSLGGFFSARIKELGAFSVYENHVAGTRNLPHRERYDVNGFFVEPFTLGHLTDATSKEPFTEEAILLRTVNCTFKSKKASFGFGFSGIALPRHVMERIYERTEISREGFGDLITSELDDLLKGLAVARECGIAVVNMKGCNSHWITAVPFANGLIIVKMKFVVGGFKDSGFGFRFEMPHGDFIEPYTSPNRMMNDNGATDKEAENIALLDCAVTYFNVTTLSEAQASYYYKYQHMKMEIGDEVLSVMARHIYEPRLPHEPHKMLNLSGKSRRLAEELSVMIEAGWIKPKEEYPFSALLPFESQPLGTTNTPNNRFRMPSV